MATEMNVLVDVDFDVARGKALQSKALQSKVNGVLLSMVNKAQQSMPSACAEGDNWKTRSIYKLPACITDINQKAYWPQMVSLGPYHYEEERLKPMEEHKVRALNHFLKRSKKPLELFVGAISQVLDNLMACYHPLDQKWHDDRSTFLQLMILDGCFMLEVLRTGSQAMNDYAPTDPVFSNHGKQYIMPYIQRDMLMLENQLPVLVLDKLLAVESVSEVLKHGESVNKLILKFFGRSSSMMMGESLHVLDVFRKGLLYEAEDPSPSPCTGMVVKGGEETIRSATELYEAGIRFKKSKSTSLKDIKFSGGIPGLRSGVLMLPVIPVDDMTETMFLNLIAFERFHVGAGNEVTSYIFFMDNIIDSERDVALLHSEGIIQSSIGSDKAVAKLFNSLSKDVALERESSLDVVRKVVSDYCKKPCHKWRASLCHTYFRSPWALASLFAALFLFVLTITQTVYSALQYYHD